MQNFSTAAEKGSEPAEHDVPRPDHSDERQLLSPLHDASATERSPVKPIMLKKAHVCREHKSHPVWRGRRAENPKP